MPGMVLGGFPMAACPITISIKFGSVHLGGDVVVRHIVGHCGNSVKSRHMSKEPRMHLG